MGLGVAIGALVTQRAEWLLFAKECFEVATGSDDSEPSPELLRTCSPLTNLPGQQGAGTRCVVNACLEVALLTRQQWN